MASDSLEYGKLATTVAIKVILGAREKVLSGKQLTTDELKYVGNSIGLFALVTSGQGEYDVLAKLNKLCDDVISESNEGVDSQVSKLPARPSTMMVGGASGKKDQSVEGKASGNPLLLQLLMGALAIFLSGNTAFSVYRLSANEKIIEKHANEQIDSNCPLDIQRSVPPTVDYYSTQAQRDALEDYRRRENVCNDVKKTQNANVANVRGQLSKAYSGVSKAVGAAISAASLVSMGPAAATPTGIGMAFTAGGAATQLLESMRLPGGVAPNDIVNLVNGISQGFTPSSSVAAPAAPSIAPVAPSAAFSLPPTGGRRTRIKKTKKRVTKKMRKTRRGIRKPLFKY